LKERRFQEPPTLTSEKSACRVVTLGTLGRPFAVVKELGTGIVVECRTQPGAGLS